MIRSFKSQEEELTQRLLLTVFITIALIALGIGALTFFAPTVGTIFGFFSKNRNKNYDAVIIPNPPVLADIPEATKEKEINITGYAQAGLTIKLYVNGPEKAETTAGADGVFTFDKVALVKGRNTIFVKAINSENSMSDKSTTYVITVDEKAPEIDIESPKDGDTIRNLDKRVIVKGKINEKATIKINERTAVVKPDLTFEFLLGVNEGDVEIKVQATDEAGNSSEKKFSIKYVKASD